MPANATDGSTSKSARLSSASLQSRPAARAASATISAASTTRGGQATARSGCGLERRRHGAAQLGHALAADRDGRHDGDAELRGERRGVDSMPRCSGLVDHVEGDDEGSPVSATCETRKRLRRRFEASTTQRTAEGAGVSPWRPERTSMMTCSSALMAARL
jgi:hypothetical protein